MANSKLNIASSVKRLIIRRNYKDSLFRRAFEDKTYLLELYNALNRTAYSDPNDLTITTLDDTIYISMKNDLSFIISSTLNLYEHQSTINPNMPIRGLIYLTKQYEAYIRTNNLDVYGRSRVLLPMPQFIVFYNGDENIPKESILRLTDSFISTNPNARPMLECTAKVININFDENDETLKSCKRLYDYSYFISEVKRYMKYNDRDTAIELAIDECIEKDVLSDILIKQRSEVKSMILRYDEKAHMKTVRRESFEDGHAEGIKSNQISSIKSLMLTLHLSMDEAMDALSIDESTRQELIDEISKTNTK